MQQEKRSKGEERMPPLVIPHWNSREVSLNQPTFFLKRDEANPLSFSLLFRSNWPPF